eukprot:1222583-Alexandrium_andersonii.AAC.1
MLIKSVQLGLSRCASRATMASRPMGDGGPLRRGSLGPPLAPPPNGHCTMRESAQTERFGAPLRG